MGRGQGDLHRLATPAGVSLALHAVGLTLLLAASPSLPESRPPMYRVDLVAAPPGPRAEGVVVPTPAPAERSAPPPPRPTTNPRAMPLPQPSPPRRAPPPPATPTTPPVAVPTPPVQPAPQAGGGTTGGRGADVANVSTPGIEFPYPGYLENIVRQVAKSFEWEGGAAPRAEVRFLIHRDGSVSNIQLTARSGVFKFDQEAVGAIEAASRTFGRLPDGYPDDVLPIIFSFDPRTLR